MNRKTVLILGGTGMLGHVLFRSLSKRPELLVYATARSFDGLPDCFPEELKRRTRAGVDASSFDEVLRSLAAVQPDIVINCIGLIKQHSLGTDPLLAITVNAQLPHRISLACRTGKARMIQISTDCVFDGRKGSYTETDLTNATDLYGQTKMLGEVSYPHCTTLRTSIIGHELKSRLGLVEWFLAQKGAVRGFTKAIYSGFPTLELARIIADYVLPNPDLKGIYNVSSAPISKYDLLKLVARRYEKTIDIEPYADFAVDRSLDSTKFRKQTGYTPPSWEELVDQMYADYQAHAEYYRALSQGRV